jgi:hypothetical protein
LLQSGAELATITPRQLESKNLQALLQEGMRDILRTIPIDLLLSHRFRGNWEPGLISRIETACAAAWGDTAEIVDVLKAASGQPLDSAPVTATALAASLAFVRDLKGDPRARFERDLLLISHVAISLARRVLEPLVVPLFEEGWSTVLKDETFALRSPLRHVPAIEAAIEWIKSSGLKGAARLLLAAAPAVGTSLSETWMQLLDQISGGELPTAPQRGEQPETM